MKLLEAAAAGNGAWQDLKTGGRSAKENIRTIYAYGTFDGATATVEVDPDGSGENFAVTGLSFTAKGAINMEVRGARVRGVVTGGTSPAVDMIMI